MTEAMVDDALVTDADREAADALDDALGFLTDKERPLVLLALARHRLAGVAAGREEAAKVAETLQPDGYMSERERSYCREHGEDIATAIRQRGE